MSNIYDVVMKELEMSLTKQQWVEFALALDEDSCSLFDDKVNAVVKDIAPEVFCELEK